MIREGNFTQRLLLIAEVITFKEKSEAIEKVDLRFNSYSIGIV